MAGRRECRKGGGGISVPLEVLGYVGKKKGQAGGKKMHNPQSSFPGPSVRLSQSLILGQALWGRSMTIRQF